MKKMMLVILATVFLGGCSISGQIIQGEKYTKDKFSEEQYAQDRYQCEHESYMEATVSRSGGLIGLSVAVDRRIKRFHDCMRAKGYREVK